MNDTLKQEIFTLQSFHTGLQQESDREISGSISFKVRYKDSEPVEDSFEIRMLIPDNYPNSLPKVFEIGDKLDPKYEHVNPDGSLCLAVPMEERQFFLKDPTLLGFVNNLIVSYFYSYCSWKKCGTFPFGEAAHGKAGIEQYYENMFQSKDLSILKLGLYKIAKNGYRGHYLCPCGSGKIVRKCHKLEVFELAKPEKRKVLIEELDYLVQRKK